MKKLSEYTIATNCADIVDCQDGVAEIRDEIDRRYRHKQDVPLYFYSRLDKLEKKLEKLAMKNYGMSYREAVIKFGYDNLRGMGKTNDKEKIATALTITIFKSSSFVTLPQTFKRRSTTTKPRLVSYTVNGISALANINEFVDTAKLLSLINNFNIDDAKTFIKAIGNCFPQQVEKEDKNKETKYDSKYQVIDFSEFGVKVLLRVSDHNMNAFNIKDDIDEAYSIVVKQRKSGNTFVNRDDIIVREYVYWEENCNRERYLKIAQNIYKFLETSEWDEDYVKADATNPPTTKGLGEITVESELQRLSPQVVEPKFFRRQIKQCLKMGRQQTAQALQVMLDCSEKSARKFVVCLYIKDKTLNHQVSAKIEWDIKKEGYRVYLATNSRELTYNKTCPQTLEQAKRIAFDGIREHRQEINRLLNTEFIDFDINNFSFEEEYGIIFDYDRWKKTQAVNPEYKVGDRIRFYYVADEYEGIIVRKEGENFIVKVPYGDGYRLRSASYKDIISISTDSISVEEYENIYWRHYNRYKATEEYKRLYEAIRSLSAAKLALEFEAKQQGKVVNTVEETITDWCETNGYSYDKYFADKVLKDYAEQQARIDGYRELVDKFSTQTGNLDEKLSILAKYFKGSRNVVKVRITQNPPEIGNDPIHAYSYPTGVAYSDVRFEQYTDGNGWDYLSVAYKFNETGEVKVSCDALPEYKELIAKLKGKDTSTKFTLFQFAQHLSSQFDNGESYDWTKVQRLAKELGVNSNPQELMQACELAVVLSARRIAQNSEWSEGQCFEQMKRLYQLQPIISTNSSESLRLQQYSTPCPISYLAGLYVSRGNGQLYYEPTAGNGMLTVALPPDRTIVNELDTVRVANLKMNGFADVLNDDAVALADSPLAQRKYNVIMNPPFGSLKPSEYLYRDGKVADNEATYTFKRLDHKIAVLTLEKFLADDNARAAIIVGGKLAAKYNKADDEAYWNKQGRLQGAFGDFISYLNRAYLIDDIFYLDGKLYGKQGTQFPIVMILVRGRRKQWDGDPLCKWRTYDSIRDKQVQSFDELLIRMRPYLAHTDHEALVQRLNAKLVRLERMKIETGTETPKFKYEIGDKFRNEKDGNICTIVDRFVSDGKIGYYLIFPNKVQEQHPVITEENWLDSLVKLPLPKYKVGQMVKWHLVNWTNGYVKDVNWDNLFNTYKYEIIDFSGGMAYEVKEYSMSKISLGYSEEKAYSISQPVCKEGDLIRDKKTKKTYTVRNVLLFNVYHKYKNQRLGVGGTVVKSSASYYYYVAEHPSPYIEKDFTVVER